jgi:GH18 family chitinase
MAALLYLFVKVAVFDITNAKQFDYQTTCCKMEAFAKYLSTKKSTKKTNPLNNCFAMHFKLKQRNKKKCLCKHITEIQKKNILVLLL